MELTVRVFSCARLDNERVVPEPDAQQPTFHIEYSEFWISKMYT